MIHKGGIMTYRLYFYLIYALSWQQLIFTQVPTPDKPDMQAGSDAMSRRALIIVPIADLTGEPLYDTNNRQAHAKDLHRHIPYAATPAAGCKRLHQILYNEVVTVADQREEEVLIDSTSSFFITRTNRGRQTRYWTLKSNLIYLSELNSRDLERIPDPIDCSVAESVTTPKPLVVTLQYPWQDPVTKQLFSVGTRFIKDTSQKPIPNAVPVFLYNAQKKVFYTSNIPTQLLTKPFPANNDMRILNYVQLIRSWINEPGLIPYVLGGCSYTMRYAHNTFSVAQELYSGLDKATIYRRTPSVYPAAGLDCSGLVLRAAQLCGIPYFLKNSTTAAYGIKLLDENERLGVGDLIWIQGHIMIVSDVGRNLIIEARSYGQGYGIVHEIPIGKVFKGVNTFTDLERIYRTQRPLERLDKNGNVADKFEFCKLLDMKHIFDFYDKYLIYDDKELHPLLLDNN